MRHGHVAVGAMALACCAALPAAAQDNDRIAALRRGSRNWRIGHG